MQYHSIHSQSPLVSSNNEPRQSLNYQHSLPNSQKKTPYQEKATRVMKNSGIWSQGISQNQCPTKYSNQTNSRNNLSNKNLGSNRNLGTHNFLLNQSSQGTHNTQKIPQNYSENGVNNSFSTIPSSYPANSNKGIFVPLNGAQAIGQRNNVEMVKSSIYGFTNSINQKAYTQAKVSLNNGTIIEKVSSNNPINGNLNENCNSEIKLGPSQTNFRTIFKPMKNSAILISSNEQNQSAHNSTFSNGFHYNLSQQNQNNFNFYQKQVFNQTSIKKKAYRKAESQNPNVSQFLISSPNKINSSFDSQKNPYEKNLSVDAINQICQKGTQENKGKQFKNLAKLSRYVQSPNFKKNPASSQQMQFLSQKNYQKAGFALNSPNSEKQDFISAPPSTPFLCKKSSNENIDCVSNIVTSTNMYESPASKMHEPTNRVKRSSSNSNQNGQINQNHHIRRSSIQNFQSVENKLIDLTKVSSILQKMAKTVKQESQQVDYNDSVQQSSNKGSVDTFDQFQCTKKLKQYPKTQKKQINLQSFSILRHLGSGKYGKVYLVRQKETNFICALKQIQKKVLHQQQITEQFIRQLKIQTFISHPNIIKMYGFFQDENNIYIILQAGTGGQLYHLLKKMANSNPTTAGLPENKVAYYMRQVCQAVKQLHSHRIIHRDIKPENIVIHDNVIKLCDFGWSVRQDSKLRTTFCGTPLYVCPQILKGQQYDQKIDIWSLGVMMYEMLIGQNPFKITKEQQLIKIVKEEVKIPEYAKITKDMENILGRCLKKNPDQRAFIRQLIDHQFFKKHPDKQMEKNRMAGLC